MGRILVEEGMYIFVRARQLTCLLRIEHVMTGMCYILSLNNGPE